MSRGGFLSLFRRDSWTFRFKAHSAARVRVNNSASFVNRSSDFPSAIMFLVDKERKSEPPVAHVGYSSACFSINYLKQRADVRVLTASRSWVWKADVDVLTETIQHGHPQAWARGGAIAFPWNSWNIKVLSRKKSISEVSLNGRDAALPWRKTANDCSTPTISFLYRPNTKELYCTRILKENEVTPDAFPRFWIGKPMV